MDYPVLLFPSSVKLGEISFRFLSLDQGRIHTANSPNQCPGLLLFLGADVFQCFHDKKNIARVHKRYSLLGLSTKLHLNGMKIDGLRCQTLWFYNIKGLFQTVFEYHPPVVQRDCLLNLTNVWLQGYKDPPLTPRLVAASFQKLTPVPVIQECQHSKSDITSKFSGGIYHHGLGHVNPVKVKVAEFSNLSMIGEDSSRLKFQDLHTDKKLEDCNNKFQTSDQFSLEIDESNDYYQVVQTDVSGESTRTSYRITVTENAGCQEDTCTGENCCDGAQEHGCQEVSNDNGCCKYTDKGDCCALEGHNLQEDINIYNWAKDVDKTEGMDDNGYYIETSQPCCNGASEHGWHEVAENPCNAVPVPAETYQVTGNPAYVTYVQSLKDKFLKETFDESCGLNRTSSMGFKFPEQYGKSEILGSMEEEYTITHEDISQKLIDNIKQTMKRCTEVCGVFCKQLLITIEYLLHVLTLEAPVTLATHAGNWSLVYFDMMETFLMVVSEGITWKFPTETFGLSKDKLLQLCIVSEWIGKEFHKLEPEISSKVSQFKTENIGTIDNLPPAEDLINSLFPQCMKLLILNWVGSQDEIGTPVGTGDTPELADHTYFPKTEEKDTAMYNNVNNDLQMNTNRPLYPLIQLILEFTNNALVSGVAHVVFSRLRYAS